MYAFVSHTYNPLKGECEHSCPYCFMKRNRSSSSLASGAEGIESEPG